MHGVGGREWLGAWQDRVALEPGDGQQLFGEHLGLVRLPNRRLQRLAHGGAGLAKRPFQGHGQVAARDGQRRPQFVDGDTHELAFRSLGFLRFSDQPRIAEQKRPEGR